MANGNWKPHEDAVVKRLYPNYDAMTQILQNRTRISAKRRASVLGIARKHHPWTGPELKRLRSAWREGHSWSEIAKMFAPRTWQAIYTQIKSFKECRLARRQADVFRYPVIGMVRDRLKERNVSLAQFARQIGASVMFGKDDNGTSIENIIKAVHYLGGEINIVWSDAEQ